MDGAVAMPVALELELVKSMLDFALRVRPDVAVAKTDANAARIRERARKHASKLAALIHDATVSTESTIARFAESVELTRTVLDAGFRTPDALGLYRQGANNARALAASLTHGAEIRESLAETVVLADEVGVYEGELADAYAAFVAALDRGLALRETYVELADDLEDIIGVIESENEQGDEPTLSHDEVRRLIA